MNHGPRERRSALPLEEAWSKERAEALLSLGYWFRDLPRQLSRALIAASEIRSFKRNGPVYRIGDTVDGMYAVLEGDLRAYVHGDDNERILIRLIGPKCWFGDFHLVDDYPTRTFEMRAHSDSVTLFLSKQAFQKLAYESVENYRQFTKLTCIQQRFLVCVAVEARSDAQRRAARVLFRIAKMHGRHNGDGIAIPVNLTQSDLASLVGVSRQYINELIARWNEEQMVKWRGNSAPVVFIEKLKTLLSPVDQWMLESEGWA